MESSQGVQIFQKLGWIVSEFKGYISLFYLENRGLYVLKQKYHFLQNYGFLVWLDIDCFRWDFHFHLKKPNFLCIFFCFTYMTSSSINLFPLGRCKYYSQLNRWQLPHSSKYEIYLIKNIHPFSSQMIQLASKILMNPKYTIMLITTFVYFTNKIIEIETQSRSNELIKINQRTNTKNEAKI